MDCFYKSDVRCSYLFISSTTIIGIPDDLYPIAILIDELKHDDVQCRLNSMRRLDTIGKCRMLSFVFF